MSVLFEEHVAEASHRHDALPTERRVELREAQPLAREVLPEDPAVSLQSRAPRARRLEWWTPRWTRVAPTRTADTKGSPDDWVSRVAGT